MSIFRYTDGDEEVTAILFENNRRAAHYAFNIINDVRLDAIIAPVRAIEYIMNNQRITLRNLESVNYGEYIVKDSNGDVNRFTSEDFTKTYTKIDKI